MTLETLGEPVDFVCTDISFISVTKIIPAVKSILKPDGSIAALIKPQFEAGREKVGKGGIVRDPEVPALSTGTLLTKIMPSIICRFAFSRLLKKPCSTKRTSSLSFFTFGFATAAPPVSN